MPVTPALLIIRLKPAWRTTPRSAANKSPTSCYGIEFMPSYPDVYTQASIRPTACSLKRMIPHDAVLGSSVTLDYDAKREAAPLR